MALRSAHKPQGWSFRHTLRELLETEASERRARRLLLLFKDSGLPEGKTLAALVDYGWRAFRNRSESETQPRITSVVNSEAS
jgi:hypothetical protein